MQLLPYLAVDTCTDVVEVANNARTLAYIGRTNAPRPAGSWTLNPVAVCPEHTCSEVDAGDYTWPADWAGNPAPWADPAVPASWEFFGLLLDGGSITLEPSMSSRRRGSSVYERADYRPRILAVTGTIVSSSARGTAYGEEWLARTFTDAGCGSGVFDVRVLKFCPDPAAPEFTSWASYTPAEPVPVVWTQPDGSVTPAVWADGTPVVWAELRPPIPGADPCGDLTAAAPLAPLAEGHIPPMLPDPGWRDLFRCRFLYLEDLDDDPMDRCEGKRVTLALEVLSEGTWFPADDLRWLHWQLIDRPFGDPTVDARPLEWSAYRPEVVDVCGTCGPPCRCTTPTHDEGPVTLPTCYRTPLADVAVTTITPVLPWSVQAGVVASIYGGTHGLGNVSVRIYEALPGVPDPATVIGCRLYSQRDPLSEALISWVPPGTTLTIDGRRRRVLLRCPGEGEQPGEDLCTGTDGLPYRHPRLACGDRYWVVIAADAYQLSRDASVKLVYVPFEVS